MPQCTRQAAHKRIAHRTCSSCNPGVISNTGSCNCRTISTWLCVGRSEDVVSQVASFPAAVVVVTPVVNIKQFCTVCFRRVITIVSEANARPVCRRTLEALERNSVHALVIDADDIHVQSRVQAQSAACAGQRHALGIANIPRGCGGASLRNGGDFGPGGLLQSFCNVNSTRRRLGYAAFCIGNCHARLSRRDCRAGICISGHIAGAGIIRLYDHACRIEVFSCLIICFCRLSGNLNRTQRQACHGSLNRNIVGQESARSIQRKCFAGCGSMNGTAVI